MGQISRTLGIEVGLWFATTAERSALNAVKERSVIDQRDKFWRTVPVFQSLVM